MLGVHVNPGNIGASLGTRNSGDGVGSLSYGAVHKPNVPVGRLYPTRLDGSETPYLQKSRHPELGKIYWKFANKENCK